MTTQYGISEVVINDRISLLEKASNFINEVLSRYDTHKLSSIMFTWTERKDVPVSTGLCWYPRGDRHNYSIEVRVRKNVYPAFEKWFVETAPATREDIHPWLRPDTYKLPTGWRIEGKYPKQYKVRDENILAEDYNDAAILTFGHELHHFLAKTKQVPSRNTQTAANRFGIEMFKEFKAKEFGLAEACCIGPVHDCEMLEHEDIFGRETVEFVCL